MAENGMRLQAGTEDFIRTFETNMGQTKTYREAYELTERQHERLTGHRRYSDYTSFSTIRYRRLRKRK